MSNKSNTIKELATALAKAQAELKAVPFDADNPFLKSRYASLGAVIETSRPVLAKNGLAVSQLTITEGEQIGVTTILMHLSGEWLESTATLSTGEERGKSSAQVAGSVITYLRRYSLASILGMYADEDTDGNHQQSSTKPAAQPAKTPAQPNGHKPAETEAVPAKMSWDMAKDVKNSEGVAYADIDTETLNNMANTLQAVLDGKRSSKHTREDVEFKRDAALAHLAHRNNG